MKIKYKSIIFQTIQLLYNMVIDTIKEIFKRKKLTLDERIDWCSKQDYFDPLDFPIGKHINDEKLAHKICDKYSAPKYKNNETM